MPLIGDRRWLHILNAAFFGIAGVLLTLDLIFEAPSFWYLICSSLWIFAALLWLARPALAAGFSIPPTTGLIILALRIYRGISLHDPGAIGAVIAVFIATSLLVLSLFRSEKLKIFPAAISAFLIVLGFGTDRFFMNQLSIHTHSVQWSGNGIAPWGDVERNEAGEIPIVLYFKTGDSYCYDAVFSPELRTLLERSSKPEITVQYNAFRTFGQERSYNIRSVEGLQFNDDEHTIRPGESYGGQTELSPNHPECQR